MARRRRTQGAHGTAVETVDQNEDLDLARLNDLLAQYDSPIPNNPTIQDYIDVLIPCNPIKS